MVPTKACENCGREVDDYVKFCPDCGSSSFTYLNSEVTVSNSDIGSSESINPLIAKLFYWNENGQHYFSKTKFFSILIFLDIFIARIYYTSNVVVSLIVALIVTFVSFFIGRSLHRKNDASVSSGELIRDIVNMLFYMDGSISKTKVLSISIYFILIIAYCINEGWSMFFAATLMFLAFAVPVYYIGKSLNIDGIK